MMIRSAKMKLITPPKLIPPFHSTAASGTLPIEQTKVTTATAGPMIGPQTFASSGWPVRNSRCQKLSGIQAPAAPAINRPRTRSRRIAAHPITKLWLTAVNPAGLASRRPKLPSVPTLMSMPACPSIDPASPLAAWSRAAASSRRDRNNRNSSASSRIITGPPTNSARVNCQPISRARIDPSSITRLVEANWKAIAAVKSALMALTETAQSCSLKLPTLSEPPTGVHLMSVGSLDARGVDQPVAQRPDPDPAGWRGRAHRPTGPHRPPHRLPEPASLRDHPVAATLPGALSCPPPRPFRQRASPEQRDAPLRNHSTHIRTLLLKPRHPTGPLPLRRRTRQPTALPAHRGRPLRRGRVVRRLRCGPLHRGQRRHCPPAAAPAAARRTGLDLPGRRAAAPGPHRARRGRPAGPRPAILLGGHRGEAEGHPAGRPATLQARSSGRTLPQGYSRGARDHLAVHHVHGHREQRFGRWASEHGAGRRAVLRPMAGTVQLLAGRRHGAAQVGADGAERRGRPRGRPGDDDRGTCGVLGDHARTDGDVRQRRQDSAAAGRRP